MIAPHCPDVELVARCAAGDGIAWSEFVERHNRRIIGYVVRERRARGVVAGANEAETVADLVQEVYLRLVANERRALREFRGDSEIALFAYLARVARAVVADHMRREASQKRSVRLVSLSGDVDEEQPTLGDLLPADEGSSPDRRFDEQLLPARLRALLKSGGASNASRDAMVFELHVLDGLSAREIAAIPSLHLSLSAVEAVLRRTRDRLREQLGRPSDLSG